MLTNTEIQTIVEGAFHPHRCVAEVWDYGQKLRFKVFAPDDKGVIEVPELVLSTVHEKSQLQATISLFRERVEEKGFGLQPWSFS